MNKEIFANALADAFRRALTPEIAGLMLEVIDGRLEENAREESGSKKARETFGAKIAVTRDSSGTLTGGVRIIVKHVAETVGEAPFDFGEQLTLNLSDVSDQTGIDDPSGHPED